MRSRLLAADASAVPLTDPLPPGVEITDGAPTAGSTVLARLDGDRELGVWEMTAGGARDVESDEVFLVLSGSASLAFADGETLDLRPGVVVRLRAGDRTEWRVHETLRKLYVSG